MRHHLQNFAFLLQLYYMFIIFHLYFFCLQFNLKLVKILTFTFNREIFKQHQYRIKTQQHSAVRKMV